MSSVSSVSNTFHLPSRCSQVGITRCSKDDDCLASCPYGDIPEHRMACFGSPINKYHGRGVCGAAWSEEGDACTQGASACMPSGDGYNDMYCHQNQLGWPNYAPGYQQNWVGSGTCQRRTLPATEVGAVSWSPASVGSDYAYAPVTCTPAYLSHLYRQGLLTCETGEDADVIANYTCSNVLASSCQNNKVVISLR